MTNYTKETYGRRYHEMNQLRKILIDTFNLNTDCASQEEIADRIKSGGQLRGTNMCIMI